jgi:hypothetical protein
MSPLPVPKTRRLYEATTLACLAMLLAACHIEPFGSSLDLAGGQMTGISVSGDSTVAVGGTAGVHAIGSVSGLTGMFSYDPLADAVWSTEDPRIATVVHGQAPAGYAPAAYAIATGVAPGQTYLIVSARGFSARWPMRTRSNPQ